MEPNEVMDQIDANIAKMLAGQNATKQQIAQMEKDAKAQITKLAESQGQVLSRIKTVDERLTSQEENLTRIESDFNKRRLDVGAGGFRESDALLNALPDDVRRVIPIVAALKGGGTFTDGDGRVFRRSGLAASMAQNDPVKYVAIGSWFHARIMAFNCARKGEATKAQMWTERAEKVGEALGGVTKVALQEDTNSEGGFLIPTVTEAMIGWLMKEASVVRAAGATVLQMTTKTHQLPSLGTDFTVNWTDEEATISDSTPATPFTSGNLTAKKQTGLVTLSIELIADNIVNLMDFVMTHLIQQLGRSEDVQALEGSGSPFTGLFSASNVNSTAGGSATLTEVMLRKLVYGGEHATTIANGKIFCHPWIVRDAMGLTTGSAGAIWQPYVFNDPNNIQISRAFFGVQVFQTSSIARNRGGGTNETTVYHGDPSYLVIGDRSGTVFDVNPYSETEYKKGQILLRVIRRVAVLVWVPTYFTKLTAVTVAA